VADLDAVLNSLVASISTAIPGLRVSKYTSQVNPPAAIIMAQPQQNLRFDTIDGGVSFLLRITILATGPTEDTSNITLLDSYISTTASIANSIPAAIRANPRVPGIYDYANLDSMRGYGLIEWAGQQYFGTTGQITVMA
jgi:hypothetical protein